MAEIVLEGEITLTGELEGDIDCQEFSGELNTGNPDVQGIAITNVEIDNLFID